MTSLLGQNKKIPSVLDSLAGSSGLPRVPGVCSSWDISAAPLLSAAPCPALLLPLLWGLGFAVVNACPLKGWISLR